MLYIVSTPIGNLEDITLRAINTLSKADLTLAEDTRKAKILLGHYDIKKPLLSFYDYNKEKRIKNVLSLLKEGREIALISEAGTPGVSDPGYFLARACVKENIPFTALPGPTAAVNALVLSGLPTDKFFFTGFLSPKKGKRDRQLKELAGIKTTLVIFESRRRLLSILKDSMAYFKDKKVVVLREMTKLYEEVLRGKLDFLISRIQDRALKGEFVIVIDNR